MLPKGADILIQVHYHKTGKPETDATAVGLYLSKDAVAAPGSYRIRLSQRLDCARRWPRGQESRKRGRREGTLEFSSYSAKWTRW